MAKTSNISRVPRPRKWGNVFLFSLFSRRPQWKTGKQENMENTGNARSGPYNKNINIYYI